MDESKGRTKRDALRFSIDGHRLQYKTEYEDGEALIENVSASGCALRDNSVPFSLNETVLLVLPLKDAADTIEIRGKIVRIAGTRSAVQFLALSEENKQRIVKYFALKMRESVVLSKKNKQTPYPAE